MDLMSLHSAHKAVKLVHERPFPVHRAGEKQMNTKIVRLVDIAVLEEDHTSEWSSSIFSIDKKMEPSELFLISEH
jgi:hypothetical protein